MESQGKSIKYPIRSNNQRGGALKENSPYKMVFGSLFSFDLKIERLDHGLLNNLQFHLRKELSVLYE